MGIPAGVIHVKHRTPSPHRLPSNISLSVACYLPNGQLDILR